MCRAMCRAGAGCEESHNISAKVSHKPQCMCRANLSACVANLSAHRCCANTQELAVKRLVSAICAHVDALKLSRPLVISVHGPPGVSGGRDALHWGEQAICSDRAPEHAYIKRISH